MSNLAQTPPQSDLDVAPLLLPAKVLRNDAEALSAAHELAQAARLQAAQQHGGPRRWWPNSRDAMRLVRSAGSGGTNPPCRALTLRCRMRSAGSRSRLPSATRQQPASTASR